MKEDMTLVNFCGVLNNSLSITFTNCLYGKIVTFPVDTLANLSSGFYAGSTWNDKPWGWFSGHTNSKISFI